MLAYFGGAVALSSCPSLGLFCSKIDNLVNSPYPSVSDLVDQVDIWPMNKKVRFKLYFFQKSNSFIFGCGVSTGWISSMCVLIVVLHLYCLGQIAMLKWSDLSGLRSDWIIGYTADHHPQEVTGQHILEFPGPVHFIGRVAKKFNPFLLKLRNFSD